MSQPSKEVSPPPAKTKSGCGSAIGKGLLVLLLVVVAGGGAYYLRMQYLERVAHEESVRKDLEQPKKLALEAVQAHDEVKAALGEPVEDRGNVQREGTGELNRANAVFSFDVGGPKAQAAVKATAQHKDGSWRVVDIKVTMSGGQSIAVPPPKGEAAQELDFNL
jgi:uncharacterized protein HemX